MEINFYIRQDSIKGKELYTWMYDNFSDALSAATKFGYSMPTVDYFLREYYKTLPNEQSVEEAKDELSLRYANRSHKKAILLGKEIYDWMVETNSSYQDASEHFNTNINTIYSRVAKYYKTIPETKLEKMKMDLRHTHTYYVGEKYCNYALEHGACYAEIAKHFGVCEATIRSGVITYYKTLSPEEESELKEKLKVARGGRWALMSNEDVYNYALEYGYTAPEIAEQFGCTENAVNGKLHKYYDSMFAHDARTKQKNLEKARVSKKHKQFGDVQPNSKLGKIMYDWALPIAASADEISTEFGYNVSFVYVCFSKYYASFKDKKESESLKEALNKTRRDRKQREFNETGVFTGIKPNKPFESESKPIQDIESVEDMEITKEQVCESKDISAVIPIGFAEQSGDNDLPKYNYCGSVRTVKPDTSDKAIECAKYYLEHDCSYDELQEVFGISHATVIKYFNSILQEIDTELHSQVREQAKRHQIRGGEHAASVKNKRRFTPYVLPEIPAEQKENIDCLYGDSNNEIRYRMGASKGGVPTKETLEEVIGIATYYLESGCTWRDITDKFKISNYTLNIYFNDLLEQIDKNLYARYKAVTLGQKKSKPTPVPNVIPTVIPDKQVVSANKTTTTIITPIKISSPKKTVRKTGFIRKHKVERIG